MKRCLALNRLVLCTLSALASVAHAQITECPNFGDGSIPYLEESETWIQDPGWMPNRMPGVYLALWNHNYCVANLEGNSHGLIHWWCDEDDDSTCSGSDGVENLISRLDGFYDIGFRRFLLYLPAGAVINHNYVSSSQWLTMPADKREELQTELGGWITTKGNVEVEIYGTFQNALPTSLCMQPSAGTTVSDPGNCPPGNTTAYAMPCQGWAYSGFPSPSSDVDMCIMYETLGPWKDLGISRFWEDSASAVLLDGNNDVIYEFFNDFLEVAHSPMYRPETTAPHFLGTEAYPQLVSGALDMPKILQAPAIGFPNFLQSNDAFGEWDLTGDSDDNEVDDREQSEVVAILEYLREYTRPVDAVQLLQWARRGFVFYVANPDSTEPDSVKLIEKMKRVYDFGTITNRRDFDGDGDIDSNDLSDFNAAYAAYHGTATGANWIHGDVDQDNDVDLSDAQKYQLWHANFSGTYNTSLNLYNAEPYDVLTPPIN